MRSSPANTVLHGLADAVGAPLWAILVAITLGGCAEPERSPYSRMYSPRPFRGPAYLKGTVGGKAYIPQRDLMPAIVSGNGLVVGLEGTGSNVVPSYLRDRMIQRMKQGGLGSVRYETQHLSPARVLADMDTAVVVVEGLIPPGAIRGTRFDLLVSTLPRTQVTSLAAGRLWQTDLSPQGSRITSYERPQAFGAGPLYVNPFEATSPEQQASRQAVIIGGAVVTEDRMIELVLRQPSFVMARTIADRINERFAMVPARYRDDPLADHSDVAVPKNDVSVEIHVPKRFRHDPMRLLKLIMHIYLEGGPDFEYEKAHELGKLLLAQPKYAGDVIPGWEALGRTALPVLRDKYYRHRRRYLSLAALEAGAKLGDLRAFGPLADLAADGDMVVRLRVADLLGYLGRHTQTPLVLRRLLDDENRQVRLAAYESLASLGRSFVKRTEFRDESGLKFILDLVPADKPMIYIGHSPVPRIAIFNPMLGFKNDSLITLWNDRLMLRRDGEHEMRVWYRKRGTAGPQQPPLIKPAVANLIYLLAHDPTVENPAPGFGFDFSGVAHMLYELQQSKHILAPLELQVNPLAQQLAQFRDQHLGGTRPDFGPRDDADKPGSRDVTDKDSPPVRPDVGRGDDEAKDQLTRY